MSFGEDDDILMLSALVAVPDISPVTLPVRFPEKLPAVTVPVTLREPRVPTDVKEEFTTLEPKVVEDKTSLVPILYTFPEDKSKFSDEVQESVASTHLNVLSPSPESRVIPPPSAAASFKAPLPRTIFLSSTRIVVELITV